MRLDGAGRGDAGGVLWLALASMGLASGALALALGRAVTRERELRGKVDRFARMAMTDPLTGLANRRYFRERLNQSLGLARRRDLPVALILADLDDFKSINDSYGHGVGDRVLQAVARQLETDKRTEDLAVRYGGEEFALLLEGTDASGALTRAERIRYRLHMLELRLGGAASIRITASFGVSCFPDTSWPRPETLIADADRALYAAKAAGRDRCVVAAARAEVRRSRETWIRMGQDGAEWREEPPERGT